MKLSTPKLSLPKFVNKTVLLVSLAVLVVLGLVAYGAVRQVQATKAQEVADARAADNRKKQAELVEQRINSLEVQVSQYKAADSDAIAICSWVDSQVAARRVVAPPLCSKY
jgi:cytochrome c-type biogenesis protein CcmH/NrfG